MTRFQSLRLRALCFGGAALLLTGWVVFRPAVSSTETTESLPALFPGFAGANATAVEIVRRGGAAPAAGKAAPVRLERRRETNILGVATETWVVASAFGYPAKEASITRLFSELGNARVASEATSREGTFSEYAEDGRWTHVTIKDTEGRALAAFGVGRSSHASREANVLLESPAPARVVRVRGLSAEAARAAPEAWLETRMFPGVESDSVEQVSVLQRVEVDGKPTQREMIFARLPAEEPKDGGMPPERGWVMRKPEEGPASRADVQDLVRALTGLLFEDVIDSIDLRAKADLAKHGLDQPEVVVTVLLTPQEPGASNPVLRLTLGKKDAEKNVWHALRRDNIGDTDDTWIFTVKENDYSTGRFRNDPAKYREAPKPPEKQEPAKDGAPPVPADHGSPDGPPGDAPPKEPAGPAPAEPKPGDPAPAEPKPGEPKPGEPSPAPAPVPGSTPPAPPGPKSPEPPAPPSASK